MRSCVPSIFKIQKELGTSSERMQVGRNAGTTSKLRRRTKITLSATNIRMCIIWYVQTQLCTNEWIIIMDMILVGCHSSLSTIRLHDVILHPDARPISSRIHIASLVYTVNLCWIPDGCAHRRASKSPGCPGAIGCDDPRDHPLLLSFCRVSMLAQLNHKCLE